MENKIKTKTFQTGFSWHWDKFSKLIFFYVYNINKNLPVAVQVSQNFPIKF